MLLLNNPWSIMKRSNSSIHPFNPPCPTGESARKTNFSNKTTYLWKTMTVVHFTHSNSFYVVPSPSLKQQLLQSRSRRATPNVGCHACSNEILAQPERTSSPQYCDAIFFVDILFLFFCIFVVFFGLFFLYFFSKFLWL